MITTLYLIRHAQSIGNEKKLFGGITDYELSELGLKQADSLAIKLQDYKIDKIYSSPLRRTIQTITPTAESKNLKINIEENLKELSCGSWENRLRSELYDLYPEIINYIDETGNFRGMQGQEEMIEAQNRMYNTIKKIAIENAGKNVIITTHLVATRAFLCKILNIPFEKTEEKIGDIKNTGITTITYDTDSDKFEVLKIGE